MPIDLRRSPSGESGEGDSCWRFQIAFEPDRKRCENGLQGVTFGGLLRPGGKTPNRDRAWRHRCVRRRFNTFPVRDV